MKGAAEKLRWPLGELMQHLASTPHMREFLTEHREGMADEAEEALDAAVNESCPWAVKYAPQNARRKPGLWQATGSAVRSDPLQRVPVGGDGNQSEADNPTPDSVNPTRE